MKIGTGILKVLGVTFSDNGDGWLSIPCIFARHTHSGGVDSKPSARFNPDGVGYTCYGCSQTHGKPSTILYTLFKLNAEAGINNDRVIAAIKYLDTQELPDVEDYEKQVPTKSPAAAFVKYPKDFLHQFPSALKCPESLTYLVSRRLPKQAILDFDIRYDPQARRVLFPYYLTKGKLAGVEGRLAFDPPLGFIGQNQPPRYSTYRWHDKTNKAGVWFRQSELKLRKPLIVVEGCFDAIRCYCHYRNVTAMLNSFPSHVKIEHMKKFPHIFWIADRDKAGEEAKERIQKIFPHNKMTFIDIPTDYKDVGDMPSTEVRELLSQYHLALDDPIFTTKEMALYYEKIAASNCRTK